MLNEFAGRFRRIENVEVFWAGHYQMLPARLDHPGVEQRRPRRVARDVRRAPRHVAVPIGATAARKSLALLRRNAPVNCRMHRKPFSGHRAWQNFVLSTTSAGWLVRALRPILSSGPGAGGLRQNHRQGATSATGIDAFKSACSARDWCCASRRVCEVMACRLRLNGAGFQAVWMAKWRRERAGGEFRPKTTLDPCPA